MRKILTNKVLLIVMDGLGLREDTEYNAVAQAKAPFIHEALSARRWVPLKTSGLDVGLPDGVMGNSEVGHLNIGAGRIIPQELVRINQSFNSGEFRQNPTFNKLLESLKGKDNTLHLFGLVSDAGVHSHLDHLFSIFMLLKEQNIQRVALHAFTDGRDTPPNSGI
jgi:2,3-bisphosphoglycerate-independent phosphoglycerate mutase